jgi:YidC/Oxa1 family membrane protein insertase
MNTSENKNLVLAMVLMLAVWLGFSFFFPPASKEQTLVVENVKESATEAVVVQEQPVSVVVTADAKPLVAGESPSADAVETSAPSREIIVETDNYQAVFTTQGARLVSFKLKGYKATAAADALPVQMYETGQLRYSTLRTTGSEGFVLKEDALYESTSGDVVEVSGQNQSEIRFQHVAANGMQYIKTFLVTGDQYTIDTGVELYNKSSVSLSGAVNLALVQHWDDELETDSYSFTGPISLVKDNIEEVKVDKLKDGAVTYGQDVTWTSFQTKYFLSVLVPGAGSAERVKILRTGDSVENIIESRYLTVSSGERSKLEYLVFIGPKEPQLLEAAGHQLDRVVHFGFFHILAKPLFVVLTFFYGFFQNYGVAIILLTVLIKIVFWPLTHKSYSSMKSMQKLQPEMQKLREKFKNDKERLNKEMMALYKTHSVNPLGGCLPMVVQIPVFFALYKVLLDSLALRHAPFAFWLTDLSAKDPYYITPILMGASMFVQQKMTPTTADPMQAKIFMMMPIVFTFMFLNFPSGLVIYWLVNNLLTILQQYFIHRKAS